MDDLVAGYRGRVPKAAILEAIELVTNEYISALPELETA